MSFAERLNEIRRQVKLSCGRVDRDPSQVHLLAVSKFQPDELIEQAYDLGLRDFGENYVQALEERRAKLAHLHEARWHLIGHLQSNKAKKALAVAHVFHALDSEKLARELNKRVTEMELSEPWPVFIEINVDREPNKSGVVAEGLESLVKTVRDLPGLKLEGLMCVPRSANDEESTRTAFCTMRQLAARYSSHVGSPLQLSMGMSHDFEIAIEEGANWIRLGRKLFGGRPQNR